MAKQKPKAQPRRANKTADARKLFDHYTALAKEASRAGDAVLSENYYQHAEHFLRVIRNGAEQQKTRQTKAAAA